MKLTQNKTNVIAPNTAFPFGSVKDDSGSNDGTPADTELFTDYVQFFEKIFDMSQLTANGLPDNNNNNFQLVQALFNVMPKKYVKEVSLGAGDGVTVVITGAEIQAAFGGDFASGGFERAHNGFLGTSTSAQPKTDWLVQVYLEETTSAGTWDLLSSYNTAGFSISTNETTGDVTVFIDVAPSSYNARIVLIG